MVGPSLVDVYASANRLVGTLTYRSLPSSVGVPQEQQKNVSETTGNR